MCGIAGIWSSHFRESALENLSSTLSSALTHRGPDASGVWTDTANGLSLAHKRLSIQDLSVSGNQPMISPSGRYAVVFNGEIYNHLDLRKELQDLSHSYPWTGSSDTETLTHCFDIFGVHATLPRLYGMFAIAVWDRNTKSLHLTRDRFGEKPLYWSAFTNSHTPSLVFSSDIASFRTLPASFPLSIDKSSVSSFFRYGYIKQPSTIYEGVYQVMPGNILSFAQHDHLPHSFDWFNILDESFKSFRLQSNLTNSCLHDQAHHLNHVLRTVVQDMSLSDVPLGCFLSGGVDSSIITAILQSISPRPVSTFTISFPDCGFGESHYDESPYAEQIAHQLGTNHTTIPLDPIKIQSIIPKLSEVYSEPFADQSQIPALLVSQATSQHGIKVVLTGDGGDEMFGGYNRHNLIPAIYGATSYLPPQILRILSSFIDSIPLTSAGLVRDKRRKLAASLRCAKSAYHLYDSLLSSSSSPLNFPTYEHHDICEFPYAPSLSEQVMLADVRGYLLNDILVKVDRASMSASLESRAPFLDYRVASLSWSLPLSSKIGRKSKLILREILELYLPSHLFSRPKAGFSVPLAQWFRGPLKQWVEDILFSSSLESSEYINSRAARQIWYRHLAGADHTQQLWSILNFQSWYQLHKKSRKAA